MAVTTKMQEELRKSAAKYNELMDRYYERVKESTDRVISRIDRIFEILNFFSDEEDKEDKDEPMVHEEKAVVVEFAVDPETLDKYGEVSAGFDKELAHVVEPRLSRNSRKLRSVAEFDEKGDSMFTRVYHILLSFGFLMGKLSREEKMGDAQKVFDEMSKGGLRQSYNEGAGAAWIDAQKVFDVLRDRGFAQEVHVVLVGVVGELIVASFERIGVGGATSIGQEMKEKDVVVGRVDGLGEADQR